MNHLLELLGRGLDHEPGDLLRPFFREPSVGGVDELRAACGGDPGSAQRRRRLGVALLREGLVEDAIAQLRHSLELDGSSRAAWMALAAAYCEHGQATEALDALRQAEDGETIEPARLFAAGLFLERLDLPAEAAGYYRRASVGRQAFVPARQRLAAICLATGDVNGAIEQYQALRRAEPQDMNIRATLGWLHLHAGQQDAAAEEFESAIIMEPENWALNDEQVESFIERNELDAAVRRLSDLIEQQGPFADLHVRLGDVYNRLGQEELAQRHYLMAIDLQPGYLEAAVKLGTHHMICGRWEEAAEAFFVACDLNDRVLLNYVGTGLAHLAAGRREEAMNSLDLASAVEPNSLLLLTEAVRLQLKSATADRVSRDALGAGPLDVHGLDADELLGRQIERHRREVRRRPHAADVRYRYGLLLRQEGRLPQACRELAKAAELAPMNVLAAVKLGICRQEVGQIEQALGAFQQATRSRTEDLGRHYRLAILFADRARFRPAVEQMRRDSPLSREAFEASLRLSLQDLGLVDRAAATWRSLSQMHQLPASRSGE